jgi:transcription elongation factor GreA
MFQEAGYRILMDPLELRSLLNRIEFSDSRTSRLEGRIRVGSSVVVKNLITGEQLNLHIVTGKNADPVQGKVSFTSVIGAQLLNLRCNETLTVNTSGGALMWKIVTVNHQSNES